jgi:ABC-2 type transport system ATP-binding protein
VAESAVVVDALVKVYRGRRVVDGASWTAQPARVTAVLGPNGAGKTTMIECCEGLRQADRGQVRVLGLDPIRDGARLRPRVGVMLQDGGLPNGARAGEVLRLVAAMHAHPIPPSVLLDELGLAEHRRTTVRRLSGGQRQRLALAVAVVGRPEVVFLDEPTAGLDPQARLAVWELVGRLRDGGAAVVLTTHLLDEAERLAERVVVLDQGRVVADGTPAELSGPVTWLQFEARPGLDLSGLTDALAPHAWAGEPAPGRYRVQAMDGAALGPTALVTVTTWCAGQQVMPDGLALCQRTLEDAFLDLTGRVLR